MSLLLNSGGGNPVDANGDGFIDGADFMILQRDNPSLIPQWTAQFGNPAVQGVVSAVPEPTSLGLLLLALAMLRGRTIKGSR